MKDFGALVCHLRFKLKKYTCVLHVATDNKAVKVIMVVVMLMFGGWKIAQICRSERTKPLPRAEIIEWNHQTSFRTT